MPDLILASASPTRAAMLAAAGLHFTVRAPLIDEEAMKAGLRAEGLAPREQADALAELKAVSVSRRTPGLVLGADQMLALDGQAFDKAPDRAGARSTLLALRGRTHTLFTAAVIARDGAPIWRFLDAPQLSMRAFSDAFLDQYLDLLGEGACASVGAYQLEGLGAQLFDRVEGDFFSVLGLPLLPLLAFLREHALVGR